MLSQTILAIIPARGESKGIARKNVKLFNGRPLIDYVIKLARELEKQRIITDHLVSTESEEIASIAHNCGGKIPFLRPNELATDTSLVVDTIIHAVKWWEHKKNDTIHSILLLQPTSPLTTTEDVKKAVKCYYDNQPEAKCLISVCQAEKMRISTLYYKNEKFLEQVNKGLNPTEIRQKAKKVYWRNGSIYISRKDLILEEKRVIDDNPLFYEMPQWRSISIDDMFDWKLGEFLMRHNACNAPGQASQD